MTRLLSGWMWTLTPGRYFFWMTPLLSIEVFHDWFWHLGVCWRTQEQRLWGIVDGKLRLLSVNRWSVEDNWWRTYFYDGYYYGGDRVRLPHGVAWQRGKQVWVEWPR